MTTPEATGLARWVEELVIDPVGAAEYTSLIGGDPAPYRDRGEVHPLSLTVLVLRAIFAVAARPGTSWTMESVVHGKQVFSFRSPVSAGPVAVETTIADAVPYGVCAAIPITCDVIRDGVVLASATALLAVPTYAGPTSTVPPDELPPRRVDRLATLVTTVDAAFVDRYAAVSGDRNPIHLDAAAARRSGLPGPIVHGTAILALAAELGLEVVGAPGRSRLVGVQGRFSSPVPVGSELTIDAWSTARPTEIVLTAGVGGRRVLRDAWLSMEGAP